LKTGKIKNTEEWAYTRVCAIGTFRGRADHAPYI